MFTVPSASDPNWLSLHLDNGQFTLELAGTTTLDIANTTLEDAWHHVMLTHDGSDLRVYLNGSLVNTLALPFTAMADFAAESGDVGVGTSDFVGALSGIYFWDRVLDATAVSKLARGVPAQDAAVERHT